MTFPVPLLREYGTCKTVRARFWPWLSGKSLSTLCDFAKAELDLVGPPRKVDVRLPGKGNSKSHGARPVHLFITMTQRIRTSRLSLKTSLSLELVEGEHASSSSLLLPIQILAGPCVVR